MEERITKNRKPGLPVTQLAAGALIGAAAVAAVLFWDGAGAHPAPAREAAALSLPGEENVAAVNAVLDAREESRFLAEEESRRAAAGETETETEAGAPEPVTETKNIFEQPQPVISADDSVWSNFRDYVIMGDSRAVGFYYYRFLERSRVLAEGGDSLHNIPEHYGTLRSLKPKYVIFCYGLNDAGLGDWKTGEAYAETLFGLVDEMRSFLPDTYFIVSSTLPATEAATRRSPGWRRIELFNDTLRETCAEHGVIFVDNDPLADAFMDTYWDEDGVHLMKAFYVYWANNIYNGMYQARLNGLYSSLPQMRGTEDEA